LPGTANIRPVGAGLSIMDDGEDGSNDEDDDSDNSDESEGEESALRSIDAKIQALRDKIFMKLN
jgi:hypothetical protein